MTPPRDPVAACATSITSTEVWPFLAAFLALLPVLIVVERRAADPVLHLSYFTDRGIAYTLRVNDVAMTTGHGEPIQKLFAFEDNEHIVGVALDLLDRYGLPDLTMRRLATELEVQPSAL